MLSAAHTRVLADFTNQTTRSTERAVKVVHVSRAPRMHQSTRRLPRTHSQQHWSPCFVSASSCQPCTRRRGRSLLPPASGITPGSISFELTSSLSSRHSSSDPPFTSFPPFMCHRMQHLHLLQHDAAHVEIARRSPGKHTLPPRCLRRARRRRSRPQAARRRARRQCS